VSGCGFNRIDRVSELGMSFRQYTIATIKIKELDVILYNRHRNEWYHHNQYANDLGWINSQHNTYGRTAAVKQIN
jgi:hypothetical protein